MKDSERLLRAGLVNRVRRDLRNWEFHLAGMHDQKSHGNWANGVLGDEGESGVGDFSDTFDGFVDFKGIADKNPKVKVAGGMALAAIDAVHGLEGDWPKVLAMVDDGEWLGSDEGSLGAYMPPELDNPEGPIERGRVVFRSTDDEGQMASTLVHELGHHLSLAEGVDSFRANMADDGPLKNLMQAIQKSNTGRDLENLENNMVVARRKAEQAGDVKKADEIADQLGFVQYLHMPEEMFARAYAQYITVKTGNPAMIGDLNRVLTDENTGGVMQWPPSEFGPISDAMDAYLDSRGLRRVRTAEGAERYGQSIGEVIAADEEE